jgi:pimeloyl-ACP methyl ester carboxylesterase
MNYLNESYSGALDRQSLIDLEIPTHWNKEIVVFIHGFMGFKDWGAWHLVQAYFVERAYGFCKLNLSHNGATLAIAQDFPDKEAFANNRYSYEVEDVNRAYQWIENKCSPAIIHLIGHSRGGGIAILAARFLPKVKSVVTWAAISSIESRFPTDQELEKWRMEGVRYIQNSRTKESLPQYFSLFTDFEKNKEVLSIKNALTNLQIPLCVIHGTHDDAVSIEEGRQLAGWAQVKLHEIKGANHVFGATHPYASDSLPKQLFEVCEISYLFFKNEVHSITT